MRTRDPAMPFPTFIRLSSPPGPTRIVVPDHQVERCEEHQAVTQSAGRRARGGPILLAIVVGGCGGCGDLVDEVRARFGELGGASGEGSELAAAKSPATLILDLVPGIEVSIDDAVVGQTSVPSTRAAGPRSTTSKPGRTACSPTAASPTAWTFCCRPGSWCRCCSPFQPLDAARRHRPCARPSDRLAQRRDPRLRATASNARATRGRGRAALGKSRSRPPARVHATRWNYVSCAVARTVLFGGNA